MGPMGPVMVNPQMYAAYMQNMQHMHAAQAAAAGAAQKPGASAAADGASEGGSAAAGSAAAGGGIDAFASLLGSTDRALLAKAGEAAAQKMHVKGFKGQGEAGQGATGETVLFQVPCLALLLAQSPEVLQEEEPEEEVKEEESKQEGEASAAAESVAAAEAVAAAPGAAAGSSLEADAEEDDDFGDFSSVPSSTAAPTASAESAASTEPAAFAAAPVASAAAVPAGVSAATAGTGTAEEDDEWGDFSDSFAPAPAAPATQANLPQADASHTLASTAPAPALAFDPDDDFGDFSSSPAVPPAAFAPAVAAPAPAAASGLSMAASASPFPPSHDSTPQFSAPGFGAFAPPPGASAAAPAAPPPAFAPPAAAPTAAVNKEISFDDDDDDFGDFAGSVAVSGSASSGRGDTAATGAVSASPEFVGVDLSSTAVTPDPSLRLDDSGAANPVLVPSNSVAAAAETAALAAAMSETHAAAAAAAGGAAGADGVASAAAVGVAAGPIPLSLFGDDMAVAELENAELSLGPFPSTGSSKPSDQATSTAAGTGMEAAGAGAGTDASTTASVAAAGAAGTGKSGNLMDLLSSLYGSSSAGTAAGTGAAGAAAAGGGGGAGGAGAGGRLEGGRLGQTFSTGRVPLAMASAAGYGGLFGLLSPGTPPTDVPLRGSMSEQVGQRGGGRGGVGGSLSGESGEGWEEQGDGVAGGTGLSFAAVDSGGSSTGGGGGDGSGPGASGASYRSSGLPGGGLQGLAADHVLPIVGAQLGEGVFTASITAALESVLQPTVIRLPNEASQKRWEETLQELAEGAESVARNEFGRLSGELVREGRMEEAYACRLHAAAVQLLPDCQGQYSMALGDGRVEAAAAVREDIKLLPDCQGQYSMALGDGRVEVAAAVREDIKLPSDCQGQYSMALGDGRVEAAAAVREHIKRMETVLGSPAAVEGWRERRNAAAPSVPPSQHAAAPSVPPSQHAAAPSVPPSQHADQDGGDKTATEGGEATTTTEGGKAGTEGGKATTESSLAGNDTGSEGAEGGLTETEDSSSISLEAAGAAAATGDSKPGRDLVSLRWDERSVGEMGELLGRSKGDARAAAFDGEFKQEDICDLVSADGGQRTGWGTGVDSKRGDARVAVFNRQFLGVPMSPHAKLLCCPGSHSSVPVHPRAVAARDLTAALLVHRRAVFWYNILSAVSAAEAASFVRLWGAVAARCADVLEAAVGVKEKAAADGAATLSALLDAPKARDYFAAITQTYGVLVVIAACAQLHRPWLSVRLGTGSAGPPSGSGESGSLAGRGSGEGEQGGGDGEGDILWAHLLRGQAAWQNGGLEAVANEVLPRVMVPLSWSDVEKVLEGAELAAVQRAAELALEGRQRHMGLVGGSGTLLQLESHFGGRHLLRTSHVDSNVTWGTLLCVLTQLPIFAFTCKSLSPISFPSLFEATWGKASCTSPMVTQMSPLGLLCALARLPIFALTSVAAVEWYGHRYLLPVANFWANHISNASPLMLVAS
ncbi:unnamed protein product [Closterium sp. NIES-64]|nr:unnamed protein product [Closterium sp. NIES-64]